MNRYSNKRRRAQPNHYLNTITSNEEERQLQRAIANSRMDVHRPSAPLCVPSGPTYYPTIEEFQGNPLTYIAKIRPQAEKYGICKIVPPAGWNPPFCVDMNSDKRFETKHQLLHRLQEGISFDDGDEHTPSSYQKYAADLTAKWKAAHYSSDEDSESDESKGEKINRTSKMKNKSMTADNLEQDYWNIVETQSCSMAVEYGNDVDTNQYWSGFPLSRRGRAVYGTNDEAVQLDEDDDYAPQFGTEEFYRESYWNLNNIPWAPGSILRHVKVGINGINVPWLYFGSLFSTFCWHNEDNYLYSINYHHTGAPKLWYGVPGTKKDADALERVFKNYLAMKMREAPDLLHHITTMISPRLLQQGGVPVFKLLQHPGEFVVTFPRSFHSGFSLGPNVGEAVNFAAPDWISFGGDANERYRVFSRPSVFSHDRLIFTIATHAEKLNLSYCELLMVELHRIIDEEVRSRSQLMETGVRDVSDLVKLPKNQCDQVDEESADYDDKRLCHDCKHVCFFSAVACECSRTRVTCLRHSHLLCKCLNEAKYLMIWTTEGEMSRVVESVEKRIKDLKKSSIVPKLASNKGNPSELPVIAPGAIKDWQLHRTAKFN